MTWLGGGQWDELGERHERSAHAVAGVVVLLNTALTWLVATLAISGSTGWPAPAVLPLTLAFGVLVGALSRAVASGPSRGGLIGRAAVAVAVGVVAGELGALVVFAGSIDRRLDEQTAHHADSTPAVAQSAAELQRLRDARSSLDDAVDQARTQRDEALVVARCEYHPTPACPQTHITGVPGVGPETRTANDLLADAQRELDNAVAARQQRSGRLDAQIADGAAQLAQARQTAIAGADRGLGARWLALGDLCSANPGALLLRLITVGFFVLLNLLPLLLRMWRGETTHDRHVAARVERDRAEVTADTAIAVKRAEVRAAAEILWAEQQLAQARSAVEAHEAPGAPTPELAPGDETDSQATNLPTPARATLPLIPDVTKAAARWIGPLVPTMVTRAIDTTTRPLRTARQVFEEFEEITFSLKRTRRVVVDGEEPAGQPHGSTVVDEGPRRVKAERVDTDHRAELQTADSPPQLPSAG
ncbi:hypothetical protein BST20_25340 [Mycobacterium branderi]|uniref:DUF4407 domain-containing protein n=1 Tax=Mycobacterium branderi TaxID=43348 RepID=A0AA91RFT1_9MYCO|nr:hypothetical protein BST20_25340 [Mycobacterium branderi]